MLSSGIPVASHDTETLSKFAVATTLSKEGEFLSGGAICTLGQALANTFMLLGLDLKDARTCVSISLIFISAALTAYGVYDNIAKYAGAGTLVPITGFANSMVSPALEFKSEGFVTGLGAKLFTVAGPVLVFGISASVLYGIVLYIIGLF